jgi:hypothetical protein
MTVPVQMAPEVARVVSGWRQQITAKTQQRDKLNQEISYLDTMVQQAEKVASTFAPGFFAELLRGPTLTNHQIGGSTSFTPRGAPMRDAVLNAVRARGPIQTNQVADLLLQGGMITTAKKIGCHVTKLRSMGAITRTDQGWIVQ